MISLAVTARRFAEDINGAAMVEYTVLIGIITAAIFVAIAGIAAFIAARWTEVGTALP